MRKLVLPALVSLSSFADSASTLAEEVGSQFANGLGSSVNAQSTNISDVLEAGLAVFSLLVIIWLLSKVFNKIAGF